MASIIQNIMDRTLGDGARSSKFECAIELGLPSADGMQEVSTVVKTAQFPGKSHEVIDFKFKGRNIPIRGQVKYDNTWTCTFYLDDSHKTKKYFDDWIEALDQTHNMMSNLSKEVTDRQKNFEDQTYTTEMKINQLDFDGENPTNSYTLYNVFPKTVSAIEVDYSSVGTVLELSVEFSFSHYDVHIFDKPESSDVAKLANKIKEDANAAVSKFVNKIHSINIDLSD